MKRIIIIFIAFGMLSYNPNKPIKERKKTGNFIGIIKNGNFSDNIAFIIEKALPASRFSLQVYSKIPIEFRFKKLNGKEIQ